VLAVKVAERYKLFVLYCYYKHVKCCKSMVHIKCIMT
jgi:hypothetical protein